MHAPAVSALARFPQGLLVCGLLTGSAPSNARAQAAQASAVPSGWIATWAASPHPRRSRARRQLLRDLMAATRDPRHPGQLRAADDSGDHLHPNDAGYRAMAEAIDLSLLR